MLDRPGSSHRWIPKGWERQTSLCGLPRASCHHCLDTSTGIRSHAWEHTACVASGDCCASAMSRSRALASEGRSDEVLPLIGLVALQPSSKRGLDGRPCVLCHRLTGEGIVLDSAFFDHFVSEKTSVRDGSYKIEVKRGGICLTYEGIAAALLEEVFTLRLQRKGEGWG